MPILGLSLTLYRCDWHKPRKANLREKALKLEHHFRHFGVIYILMELANGKYLGSKKTPISLQISIISISL